MESISKICQKAKQPHGGYFPLKNFKQIEFDFLPYDGNEEYNISPNLFGNAIDYGSRIYFDDDAFDICQKAAKAISVRVCKKLNKEIKKIKKCVAGHKEYSKEEITSLCNVVYFDIIYRSGQYSEEDLFNCEPDDNTAFLINLYIKRTLMFFNEVGPVIATGGTFEDAITHLFTSGDCDFLTENTIWDIKALKVNPNAQRTMQVACYYIAAKHSNKEIYKNINSFGIFNPRKNTAWILYEEEINNDVLSLVSNRYMGYEIHNQADLPKDVHRIKEKYKNCQYYHDVSQAILYIVSYSEFNPLRYKDREYLKSINMDFLLDGREIFECFKQARVDLGKVFNPGYFSKMIDLRHKAYEIMNQKDDSGAEKFLRISIAVAKSYIALVCEDQEENYNMSSELYNVMHQQKEAFMTEKRESIEGWILNNKG